MKKINNFLSIEPIDNKSFNGHICNGKRKAKIKVNAPSKNVTFSDFFQYCIDMYEIYLCGYCDKEFFLEKGELFGITEERIEELFNDCVDIANKLEYVFEEKTSYFICNFVSPSLTIWGTEFVTFDEKLDYLINSMEYRLNQKAKGNDILWKN